MGFDEDSRHGRWTGSMFTDICPVKDAKDMTKLTNLEGLQPPASHGRCDSQLIMKAKHPGETQE